MNTPRHSPWMAPGEGAAELVVDPVEDRVLEASAVARRLLGCGVDGLSGLCLGWGDGPAGAPRVTVSRAGPDGRPAGPHEVLTFPYTAVVIKQGGRSMLRLRLAGAPARPAPGRDRGVEAGAGEGPMFSHIVGRSSAVRNTLRQVELVAPTGATVLITGESGTGKELIARAIHKASDRGAAPLVRVNCAAVPRELFESEFFGHVKGAYTGAVQDRVGRFELAHGGTLFLDEVGEIPLDLQGKLLRVLQEGQFERIGDTATRSVDVRVVAATNRDLHRDVAARRFREDLFYRLNVFPIESVPLRQRPEDIPLLASHFLLRASRRLKVQDVRLTAEDIRRLQGYHWPGNVRELENVIERGAIAATGGRLVFELPEEGAGTPGPAALEADPVGEAGTLLSEADRRRRDREMIVRALEQAGGKVFGPGGAAELLGVKPTTLASRMKRMGIEKRGRG